MLGGAVALSCADVEDDHDPPSQAGSPLPHRARRRAAVIESLLLSTTRVLTFAGSNALTSASGFFFRRDGRLHLATCRHVMRDEASDHHPDRVEIEVHTDATTLSATVGLSMLLYAQGRSVWRQAADTGGAVDVAVLPIEAAVWPERAAVRPFGPEHLVRSLDTVRVGAPLLIPGYPLGFHDTVHHLPVVRQACVASAFGVRFQGEGCFLTDGRTHRGSSGAPVVAAWADAAAELPWRLLGVHSSRLDMRHRDRVADESLGLNSAWYADVLMVLTEPAQASAAAR